jgi:hypothetical protein
METNGVMTIYRRADDYAREVIPDIMWQGQIGAATTERGLIVSDSVIVFVPISARAPETGDYIVFGECPFQFTDEDRVKALRASYAAREVMGVATFNYGSPNMRHYEVMAV